MRALKVTVIAMGVLLVAGFAVLVFGFVQLMAPSPGRSDRPIAEVPLDALGLPASSRIVALTALDGRLIVLIETVDGDQSLLTVDPGLLMDTVGGDR